MYGNIYYVDNDTTVKFVADTPQVSFVTAATSAGGGGGANPLTLKTSVYNFSLSASSGVDFSLPFGSTYYFVGFTCTQPDIRARGYTSVAARAADVSRSTSTWADSSMGVVFDGLTATGYLSMNWSPAPAGYTVDQSTSIPLRIDNKATTSSNGTITFYYYSS